MDGLETTPNSICWKKTAQTLYIEKESIRCRIPLNYAPLLRISNRSKAIFRLIRSKLYIPVLPDKMFALCCLSFSLLHHTVFLFEFFLWAASVSISSFRGIMLAECRRNRWRWQASCVLLSMEISLAMVGLLMALSYHDRVFFCYCNLTTGKNGRNIRNADCLLNFRND